MNNISEFTLEDLNKGFQDDTSITFGMEMALMGILESGGKYLLQVFLDEYEYETPHINLTTATKPPSLLAKIVIPENYFLKDKKQKIEILYTGDDFVVNTKLKNAIGDWFRKDNKYGQNNLEHSRQTWDEQAASKSYGRVVKKIRKRKQKENDLAHEAQKTVVF
ncbi:hypothetical protein AGMMS49928_26560 [Spirochaetia bacterium]|nr:hypothetical protein AGMMS49928_26560 [Spirochaetia bacterium]